MQSNSVRNKELPVTLHQSLMNLLTSKYSLCSQQQYVRILVHIQNMLQPSAHMVQTFCSNSLDMAFQAIMRLRAQAFTMIAVIRLSLSYWHSIVQSMPCLTSVINHCISALALVLHCAATSEFCCKHKPSRKRCFLSLHTSVTALIMQIRQLPPTIANVIYELTSTSGFVVSIVIPDFLASLIQTVLAVIHPSDRSSQARSAAGPKPVRQPWQFQCIEASPLVSSVGAATVGSLPQTMAVSHEASSHKTHRNSGRHGNYSLTLIALTMIIAASLFSVTRAQHTHVMNHANLSFSSHGDLNRISLHNAPQKHSFASYQHSLTTTLCYSRWSRCFAGTGNRNLCKGIRVSFWLCHVLLMQRDLAGMTLMALLLPPPFLSSSDFSGSIFYGKGFDGGPLRE